MNDFILGFRERLYRQIIGVWPIGQLDQSILQRRGQVGDMREIFLVSRARTRAGLKNGRFALEFATYFDGIYGSLPGGELEHKPELVAYILSKHNISPSRSLMVGDRRYDISGAHAVGMRGLGVLWGYGTRDELETAGADQLVESAADLARTVLSMIRGKSAC
jgi:phosphoglycolate phosphatase-like HAD superfamily hydrolase